MTIALEIDISGRQQIDQQQSELTAQINHDQSEQQLRMVHANGEVHTAYARDVGRLCTAMMGKSEAEITEAVNEHNEMMAIINAAKASSADTQQTEHSKVSVSRGVLKQHEMPKTPVSTQLTDESLQIYEHQITQTFHDQETILKREIEVDTDQTAEPQLSDSEIRAVKDAPVHTRFAELNKTPNVSRPVNGPKTIDTYMELPHQTDAYDENTVDADTELLGYEPSSIENAFEPIKPEYEVVTSDRIDSGVVPLPTRVLSGISNRMTPDSSDFVISDLETNDTTENQLIVNEDTISYDDLEAFLDAGESKPESEFDSVDALVIASHEAIVASDSDRLLHTEPEIIAAAVTSILIAERFEHSTKDELETLIVDVSELSVVSFEAVAEHMMHIEEYEEMIQVIIELFSKNDLRIDDVTALRILLHVYEQNLPDVVVASDDSVNIAELSKKIGTDEYRTDSPALRDDVSSMAHLISHWLGISLLRMSVLEQAQLC